MKSYYGHDMDNLIAPNKGNGDTFGYGYGGYENALTETNKDPADAFWDKFESCKK